MKPITKKTRNPRALRSFKRSSFAARLTLYYGQGAITAEGKIESSNLKQVARRFALYHKE